MKIKSLFQNNLFFFCFMTYVVFLGLFFITGVIITFISKNKVVENILKTICAWSSFFVLILFFERFYKGKTKKEFFKELFMDKIDLKLAVQLILLEVFIFFLSISALSLVKNIPIKSMFEKSLFKIILYFFTNLISGPLGEEPGWRGYFLTELNKSKSILFSSIINGILWGMWHFPLWLLMGYKSLKLLVYVSSFLVSIISSNIVIGYVFLKNRNIIYVIIIHQLVNYLVCVIYVLDRCSVFVPFALFQLITALSFILYNERQNQYSSFEVNQ